MRFGIDERGVYPELAIGPLSLAEAAQRSGRPMSDLARDWLRCFGPLPSPASTAGLFAAQCIALADALSNLQDRVNTLMATEKPPELRDGLTAMLDDLSGHLTRSLETAWDVCMTFPLANPPAPEGT